MSETGMGTTSSFISMLLAVSICVGILFPPYLAEIIVDVGNGGRGLTASVATTPYLRLKRISGRRDSNSRHRPWEGRALPAELLPLGKPDFSIALSQLLAHRPDDRDQFRHPRSGPLDLGGVEDLDRIGLVQPHPAAIPGLQVELLAQPGLDHQQLPRQTVRDAVIDRRLGFQVKPQLEPAVVRVPPGFEVQSWVIEEPLRLAGAGAMANSPHLNGERRRDPRGQRSEKSGRSDESPLAPRGLAMHLRKSWHRSLASPRRTAYVTAPDGGLDQRAVSIGQLPRLLGILHADDDVVAGHVGIRQHQHPF